MATGIGKRDPIARDRAETGGDSGPLSRAESFPNADHDQDPEKAHEQAQNAVQVRMLLGERQHDHREGGQRRRGVDDAGQDGGNVSLAHRKQGERDAVHQHRHHEQVTPRGEATRQSRAGQRQNDEQGGAADGETHERHLNRREHLEPELDPPEGTAPDRAEQDEGCLPGKASK